MCPGLPVVVKRGGAGPDDALKAGVRHIQALLALDQPRPRIAFALSDPADAGTEAVVKVSLRVTAKVRVHASQLFQQPWLYDVCRPLVIGHPDVLRRAISCSARNFAMPPCPLTLHSTQMHRARARDRCTQGERVRH